MHTAIIQIGQSSSRLLILDERRHGPSLNLIWGYGCDGDGTPRGRADVLLTQNGYRRIGDWTTSRAGDSAPVKVVGEVGECSCWQVDELVKDADYWCPDHRA